MEDIKLKKEPIVVLQSVEIFACQRCTQVFTNVEGFMNHVLVHAQLAFVKLTRINKKLSEKYDDHNYLNTNVHRKFKCKECGRMFVQENTLLQHQIVHEPYPFVCHCGIGYYVETDLKQHMTLVHKIESKPIIEKVERKPSKKIIDSDESTEELDYNSYDETKVKPKIKVKSELNGVNRKNKKPKNRSKIKIRIGTKKDKVPVYVECPICQKKLKNKLGNHLETHVTDKKYKCLICNKCFKTKPSYGNHVKKVHQPKSFKCQYCDKNLSSKGNMILHERIHTGEKPYNCQYCAKPFGDPSAFARHIRTHTHDMRYFCDLCPKAFTDKSGLIGHKLRHFNRKYKCDICDSAYFTKYDLDKHFSLHADRKQYECHDCGKKFNLKQYLVSHWQHSHKNQKQKPLKVRFLASKGK
ncbi:unnamed protein product [Leptidea sinapis]|uniref:C2H2-type domain-containing protein n=1 Tax=Leptidea sinapis TaxID=189913 RepID=A0A5E4QLH4_9NEOP|nr:unnamed protein product [Leptidea sinapis]